MKWAVLLLVISSLTLMGCIPRRAAQTTTTEVETYDPTEGLPGGTKAYFSLDLNEPTTTFFDQPWPSELRQREDGRVDLTKFPGRTSFLGRYLTLAESSLRGASISPTMYVRFAGTLALSRESINSSILLIDIDQQSPERGKRWPVLAQIAPSHARHIPPGTLEVRVMPGFILRPGTRYALVVQRDLITPALGTTLSLEATKATVPRKDPLEEHARQTLAPVYEQLEALQISRKSIAALTSFQTQDPTAFTRALLHHAANLQGDTAPKLLWAGWDAAQSRPQDAAPYYVLRGVYCTPNYQQRLSEAPFLPSGGEILKDQQERPILAPLTPTTPGYNPACGPLLPSRFILSIPTSSPPREGYPLVIAAHGTGGSATSFLGSKNFSAWAASRGIAVLSTDQPLHGAGGEAPRPGSHPRSLALPSLLGLRLPVALEPSMLFYNPLNPAAARDNLRQATVDAAMLIQLFAGLDLGAAAQLRTADGAPASIRFRRDRILLAGHSQGSQSLAVLGALDPHVRAVVLSGCGGDTRYGILGNKEFAHFRPIAETLLGMAPGELDEFHPFLALIQALSDPVDPQSYAWIYNTRTPTPRSVLHIEGIGDSYTPNISAEALAIALEATPLAPLLQVPRGYELFGKNAQVEVSANAQGGQSTLVFVQKMPTHREDGHFVIYAEPEMGPLIGSFLAEAAEGKAPKVRW